jgi:hypothetical protein
MGVLFEDDARRQLLAKLGFSEAMVPQAAGTGAATGGARTVCVCVSSCVFGVHVKKPQLLKAPPCADSCMLVCFGKVGSA